MAEQLPKQAPDRRDESQVLNGQVEDASPGTNDYMSEWGRRANALSERAWGYWQIVLGAILGLACAASLFFIQAEGFLPLNFLVAFMVAKFGPDALDKWFERKAPRARIAMLAALGACLLAYTVYNLVAKP